MKTTLQIKRLTAGTLFRLVAIGTFIPMVGYLVVCGLLAYSGAETVRLNGQAVTGTNGLLAAVLIAPIFWLLATVLIWLMLFVGLWLYSLLRPIEIHFVPAITENNE